MPTNPTWESTEVPLERQLQDILHTCGQLGLVPPDSVETLIVLDRQFMGVRA